MTALDTRPSDAKGSASMGADKLRSVPLEELRRRFMVERAALPRGWLSALREDPRAGARALGEQLAKAGHAAQAEGRRLSRLLAYERAVWATGVQFIAGVDEAGMAPLAGPVVAAAVILPLEARLPGVDDSKQLLPEEREALAPKIRALAIAWAIGRAEVEEIDSLNIYHAGLLAMHRAVTGLRVPPQHLLVDARKVPGVSMPQQGIIKGDAKSLSIAAASILAKTHRDALLAELDAEYPGYGFVRHKGYPTPEHFAALDRLGACAVHRRSFAPVRRALGLEPKQEELFANAARSDALAEAEASRRERRAR